eukprot:CAMPEP_0201148230 /NCGR_PEP_ID=MMETSP0851-20130426/9688_1 /ASSEMBLY_ACC=CAM_ASM_000631 /TAXON_ID=183588 /ORGANISM="Pseudo-nitzschia fraudulenta, Strain WWA7" /LENGTH=367 /DNA_ID=CAMNT_0047424309 /DNA_START=371 /DNA_END=1474 /DNA_ORIENTATION=-
MPCYHYLVLLLSFTVSSTFAVFFIRHEAKPDHDADIPLFQRSCHVDWNQPTTSLNSMIISSTFLDSFRKEYSPLIDVYRRCEAVQERQADHHQVSPESLPRGFLAEGRRDGFRGREGKFPSGFRGEGNLDGSPQGLLPVLSGLEVPPVEELPRDDHAADARVENYVQRIFLVDQQGEAVGTKTRCPGGVVDDGGAVSFFQVPDQRYPVVVPVVEGVVEVVVVVVVVVGIIPGGTTVTTKTALEQPGSDHGFPGQNQCRTACSTTVRTNDSHTGLLIGRRSCSVRVSQINAKTRVPRLAQEGRPYPSIRLLDQSKKDTTGSVQQVLVQDAEDYGDLLGVGVWAFLVIVVVAPVIAAADAGIGGGACGS